ncbi:MAG TPA: GGDEF domain-containing protein [Tepidiformaceae bacterium]|nr:GGDEF domain-containing protein [Tepidiformaceae bacterium]
MSENRRARWKLISLVGWDRLITLGWLSVGGLSLYEAVVRPGAQSLGIAGILVTLFFLSQLRTRLSRQALHRGLRDLELRLENASYMSEFKNIPNRNYLLDQLRREMPRARAFGEPFVLVIVCIDDLKGIAGRRGEAYGALVVRSLARLIERFTRASDFAAQLEEGCYCVLLYDCTETVAQSYLRRIPGSIAVSTGKEMLEVPLAVRMAQYDMESFYAIDVLREVEEGGLARPPEPLRFGAEAA